MITNFLNFNLIKESKDYPLYKAVTFSVLSDILEDGELKSVGQNNFN
jgi:hypothetical protein